MDNHDTHTLVGAKCATDWTWSDEKRRELIKSLNSTPLWNIQYIRLDSQPIIFDWFRDAWEDKIAVNKYSKCVVPTCDKVFNLSDKQIRI